VLWGLAVICGADVLWEKFAHGIYAHNQPMLLLAVFLATLGVQFIMLGLLAELAHVPRVTGWHDNFAAGAQSHTYPATARSMTSRVGPVSSLTR